LTPIARFDLQHEMNRRELARLERELREYLDGMVEGMGRVERKAAMRNYVVGLLLDGERKSVEPGIAGSGHEIGRSASNRGTGPQAG